MLCSIGLAKGVRIVKLESFRHLIAIQITVVIVTLLWLGVDFVRQSEHTVLVLF